MSSHQSVSNTGPVCPRNSGICSGSRPFSLTGITANAPPPLASQLTERYSGLAWPAAVSSVFSAPSLDCILIAHLHQIRVPRIATDMQIVVARLLPGGFSKNVSWCRGQLALVPYWRREAYGTSTRAQSGLPSGLN